MLSISFKEPSKTNQLIFRDTVLNSVSRSNKIWFTAVELAKALEYKKSDAVTQIYERNSDEFTPAMTETLKMRVSGNYQKTVRIFSLRGAHLVAMFSKTSVAKEFRKWVLDILDREVEKDISRTPRTTVQQRNPLKNAVNLLVSKKGLLYPEAYSLVHQRFNVEHIDELTTEQLPQAIEYVHKMAMEGEYLGKEEPSLDTNVLPDNGKVLVVIRDRKIQDYQTVDPNSHVLTLNTFMELAQKAGYLIIHKESFSKIVNQW